MKFILACLTALFFLNTHANDLEGYILKNGSDTIRGMVDVQYVEKLVNGRKQPVFPDMWMEINFTPAGGKKTRQKAGEIQGYEFKMNGNWYHFEVLDYEKNYNTKIPKMLKARLNDMRFFLHRIHDGAMPIYREYWDWVIVRNDETRNSALVFEWETGKRVIEWELWTRSLQGQLIEVAPSTGKAKKLKGFLEVLKLEPEFTNTLTDKDGFNTAEEVLVRYNEWKKSR